MQDCRRRLNTRSVRAPAGRPRSGLSTRTLCGLTAGAHSETPPTEGLRRLFGEIAGYLGASFVVGATLLFLGEEWDALGRAGRFSIVAAMAVILFGSGVAVRWRPAPRGAQWWHQWSGDTVRRRLSSTLLTGAALAVTFAAYVGLELTGQDSAAPDGRLPVDCSRNTVSRWRSRWRSG
jgi:hypothetical protein